MAHQSSIYNKGKTVAVIASGFDNIYPKENIELANKIIENGGCIISEYPPKTEAILSNFPNRNRIIAGLSIGVLVAEAKYRSGSTITAKFAKNQNKLVFCVPNDIYETNGVGTNNLIKNGAIFVTEEQDILNCLGIKVNNKTIKYIENEKNKIKKLIKISKTLNNRAVENETVKKETVENKETKNKATQNKEIKKEIPNEYKSIYNIIKNKPENINNIAKKANLTISQTNQILTMMEIEDLIKRLPSNEFKIL